MVKRIETKRLVARRIQQKNKNFIDLLLFCVVIYNLWFWILIHACYNDVPLQ